MEGKLVHRVTVMMIEVSTAVRLPYAVCYSPLFLYLVSPILHYLTLFSSYTKACTRIFYSTSVISLSPYSFFSPLLPFLSRNFCLVSSSYSSSFPLLPSSVLILFLFFSLFLCAPLPPFSIIPLHLFFLFPAAFY